jgi:hypothetical protein
MGKVYGVQLEGSAHEIQNGEKVERGLVRGKGAGSS